METEKKVELYKVRTIGERFSAAGDFVRQNWKLLVRNIFYIGVPIAVIHGFLSQKYMQGTMATLTYQVDDPMFFISAFFMMVVSFILYLFLYSMTGAILYKYSKNELPEDAGWNDLKGDMFSIMGKIFIQGLILGAFVLVLFVFLGALSFIVGMGISSLVGGIFAVFLVLILFAVIIIFIPSLSLVTYPVYFEQKSAWESMKKGFRLGFRNWGAVFLTVMLGGMLAMAVYYIISMPYLVYTMVNIGTDGSFMGYILAAISSVVMVIVYPILTIFIGLQYTSIIEKEEGISLQEKIEDFDQL